MPVQVGTFVFTNKARVVRRVLVAPEDGTAARPPVNLPSPLRPCRDAVAVAQNLFQIKPPFSRAGACVGASMFQTQANGQF